MTRATLTDVQAERALLAALLAKPALLDALPLPPDAWTVSAHEAISGALRWLYDAGLRVTEATIAQRLASLDVLRGIGGESAIYDLAVGDATLVHAEVTHARVLALAALRRQREHLMRALASVEREDAAEAALHAAAALEHTADEGGAVHTMQALGLDAYHRATGPETPGMARPLLTGIGGIDTPMGGSDPGDVILVVARTNVGKTSFALQLAENMLHKGKRAGIIQVEDGQHLTGNRILSRWTGVPTRALRARDMSPGQHDALASKAELLSQMTSDQGYLVACMPGASDSAVIRTAASMVRKHKCSLIVVDYIQAVKCSTREQDLRAELLTIGARLKTMAQKLQCVVVITSQATTETGGEAAPPKLSDVRDCKVLESQCDTGFVLWEQGDLVMGKIGKTKAEGKGARFAFTRGPGGMLVECDVPTEATGGYRVGRAR